MGVVLLLFSNFIRKKSTFFRYHRGVFYLCATIILLFVIFFLIFKTQVIPSAKTFTFVSKNNSIDGNKITITSGTTIKQTFIPDKKLYGVSLMFEHKADAQGTINIQILDLKTGQFIYNSNAELSAITNDQFYDFLLNKPVENTSNKQYEIVITSKNITADDALTICTSKSDYSNGSLYIDGTKQINDISFKSLGEMNTFLIYVFCSIAILMFLLIVFIYFMIFVKKCKPEHIFIIMTFVLGIIYMFVMTPYSIPDETSHISTAYRYSNVMMLKPYWVQHNKMLMRASDYNFEGLSPSISRMTYKSVYDNLFKLSNDNTLVAATANSVNAFPFLYLPSGLGITVARLLDLGYIPLLYMGRFFNLIFFVLCTYFAIRKIPFGKMIIFTVCLMPMTLQLAASFSYDAIVNGLALLFLAYCLSAIYEKPPMKKREFAVLCISGALLAPSKIVYLPLIFLCILIPRKKFSSVKRYVLSIVSVLGISIASLAAFMKLSHTGVSTTGQNLVAWTGTPGYTVSYILHHFVSSIGFLLNNIYVCLDGYFIQLIGKDLGWFNVDLPFYIILLFFVLLLLSAVKQNDDPYEVKVTHKAWFAIVSIGIFLLIELALWTSWTPIGSATILGVQGRYFIPILPVLLILTRNSKLVVKGSIDNLIMFATLVVQALTVLNIINVAINIV